MNFTKQQLALQILTVETYLEQLRTMAAAVEPEAVKEWPQDRDHFWTVDGDADVLSMDWIGATTDRRRLAIGNCFRTQGEAGRRVEALKVQAELRRMPGRCAYNRLNEDQFFIYFNETDGCVDTAPNDDNLISRTDAIAGVWFSTEEAAKHALDTIGQDRLAVYLADFLDEPMGDE